MSKNKYKIKEVNLDGAWHYQVYNTKDHMILQSGPFKHKVDLRDRMDTVKEFLEEDDVHRFIEKRIQNRRYI